MLQAVRSSEQMAMSMKDATRLLGTMNRSMNLPQLQRIAMEFEKENDMMDQRQEMMDDALDDAMGDGLEEDEEADEIVNQVLDEIGIDLNSKMTDTPTGIMTDGIKNSGRVAQAIGGGAGESGHAAGDDDDDLQARLDNLKRG